jgi:ABC-2 type transport system ATP-binding protein
MVTGMSSADIGIAALDGRVALTELTPQQVSLENAFMALTRDSVQFAAAQEQV